MAEIKRWPQGRDSFLEVFSYQQDRYYSTSKPSRYGNGPSSAGGLLKQRSWKRNVKHLVSCSLKSQQMTSMRHHHVCPLCVFIPIVRVGHKDRCGGGREKDSNRCKHKDASSLLFASWSSIMNFRFT